jgi:hypothetical protein
MVIDRKAGKLEGRKAGMLEDQDAGMQGSNSLG